MELDGKVVLVTGAARGQGAAEAKRCAEAGARVVLTDVLTDDGRATADAIGTAARFVEHDVRDPDAWAHAIGTALDAFGRLDGLVNNAAIHHVRAIGDETKQSFDEVIQINLVGPFLGVQAALAPMRAAGGGSIVNIASTAGLQGYPGHAAYGSAKWGVRGLSRVAALEYGRHGIRVNTILPGPIDTPMLPVPRDGTPVDERFRHQPIPRAGRPEEIAEMVVFLLSEKAAYMTGAEIVIDGGISAGGAGGANAANVADIAGRR